MVAIFTGLGAGFERGSAAQLGSVGLLGNGAQGRGGDNVSVNAATGNLLINRRDEFLVGRGPDVGISRTYNSHGYTDGDDNNDRWRQSTDRRLRNSTGTLNTNGATVTRVSGDGSEIVYTYHHTYKGLDINGDIVTGSYRATDGSGAHDSIVFANNKWTWSDGDTDVRENYYGTGTYIQEQVDRDGNIVSFTYSGGRLSKIETDGGGYLKYTWSTSDNIVYNIASIETYANGGSTITHTRTGYVYDNLNRLVKVVTDLNLADSDDIDTSNANATAVNGGILGTNDAAYTTTYTYVGTTNLVETITQTDGSELKMTYDGQWRVTSIRQKVADGDYRLTKIGYSHNTASVTDPSGGVTTLWYDNKGQLIQIQAPVPEPGGDALVVQIEYDDKGNVLRTINTTAQSGTIAGNLIENADWGGGEFARRGANLVDDGGWPQDVDTVPTGSATVDGWSTAYAGEANWTSTTGPYGEQVVSMQAGQTDTGNAGGGALTNSFTFDGTKSYEFTYYLRADQLDKHKAYFGLGGAGSVVKNGHNDSVSANPYFTHAIPNAGSGIEAGRWYKVVAYVLPEDAESAAIGSYGGVYDTESGEKVRDISHFRWNENRTSNSTYSRFFNFYNTHIQGQFTHYYKPEVREVIGGGLLTDNAVLDVERDAALLSKPTVDGWINNNSYVGRQEARWAEVDGPNGSSIVALETGQFDSASVGGGNWTNEFTIDPTKNYKFTQYVRKSDLTKHNIYFGLSASTAGNEYVKYAHTGNATTNPYFMSLSAANQPGAIEENKWYKVVGYVLAEGSANVAHGTLGGIFDAETGAKVYNTYAYRWNETRPDNDVFARFFNYYNTGQHDWTTQWGAPEVTAIDGAILTSDSANPFGIVYDESGEQASFTYDSRGNILTSTDKNGVVSYRSYDENNNLLRVRYESSRDTAVNGTHYTRYVYDSENHLRYSISAEGNVTEYTYEGASGSVYGHDGDLRSIREYTEHAYPKGGTVPTLAQMDAWRNGLGTNRDNVKLFENRYDTTNGNLVQTVDWASTTDIGNALSGDGYTQTYFTRDSSGKLLSHRVNGQVTTNYTYDGLGRTLTSSNLHGGTTTISFQDAATTTTITSSADLTTTRVFNKAGDLISQSEVGERVSSATSLFKYDNNGRLRMSTDATGYKNYYLYDNAGNKTADINHSGFVTEYRYDENGQLLASAAYTRYKPTAERTAMLLALADPNNNLTIEDVRYSPDPVTNHHSYDIWQWTSYDAKGQITRTALGDGSVTTYAYDKAGRLVKTTSYANKLSSSVLATLRSGENLENVGLPTADANKDGVVRTFYDRDGLVIGTLNGEGYLTQIIYDEAGQKIQEISFADDTNPADRASKAFSTLLATVTPNASEDISVRYVYDGQGHLRYTIDALNYVTEFVYRSGGYNTATGVVRQTIQHASPLAVQSSYAYTDVRPAIDAMASNPDNRLSWVVYNSRNQVIYSIDASGAVTQFQYDENGNVTRTMQYSVKRTTSTMPSLTTMNNFHNANWNTARITSNYYNSRNQLDYTIDPEGYVTTFTFDTEGRKRFENRWSNEFEFWQTNTEAAVLALNLGTAQTTQFVYDTRGLVKDIYDPEGTRTYFGRYANGTLAWEIKAFAQGDDEARTLYAYDAAGRKKWTRTYSKHYSDVNAAGQREYNTTFYYYDGVGNLTQVKEVDATTEITSPDQNTYFTYDKNGQVLTQTNAEGGVTSFEYNAFGQVVKMTDPENNSSYTYYDNAGRVRLQVDAENYVTKTTYTDFNEVDTVKRFYNKATGVGNTAVDPVMNSHSLDATTSFEYDKLGRLVKSIDALGFFETYALNAYGQRETVTNKEGGLTHYNYDNLGRLIEKTGESFSSYSSAIDNSIDSLAPQEFYQYDNRGNLIEVKTLVGKTPSGTLEYARSINYYDDLGRVTHQISAEGTLTRNFYDRRSNLIEARVYDDEIALPTTVTSTPPADPGADYRVTLFEYDQMDRMIESKVPAIYTGELDGTFTTGTNDLVTKYEYDANSNLVRQTDPNSNSIYMYYDKLGRKVAQVDADNYLTKWEYDDTGNVLKETVFATQIATPVLSTVPGNPSSSSEDRVTNYTYDKVGNRETESREGIKIHNGSGGYSTVAGTVAFTYNASGQVLTRTEATGDNITYIYDKAGRVTEEFRTSYAGFGGTTTPRVNYAYDKLGNLTQTIAQGRTNAEDRTSSNVFDNTGRMLTSSDAEGFTTTYRYDAAGRIVRAEYSRVTPTGAPKIEAKAYEYDLEGRVVAQGVAIKTGSTWSWGGTSNDYVSMEYNTFGDIKARGLNGVNKEIFEYDNAGRIWKTTAGDGIAKFFVYDNNGNQTLSITATTTNLNSYSTLQGVLNIWGSNRATIATTYKAGVVATLTSYDSRNLATDVLEPQRERAGTTKEDLTTSRAYNAFGEVISETNADLQTIDYTYNTMGRRITVESPEVEVWLETGLRATDTVGNTNKVRPTEHFYYDESGRLVAEEDAEGNFTEYELLVGTGYRGSEALRTRTLYDDDGIMQVIYDAHGNERQTKQLVEGTTWRTTSKTFDKMGRVKTVTHPSGLVDTYEYDGLGQQIRHWNNQSDYANFYSNATGPHFGSLVAGVNSKATTTYDAQGRVISRTERGGDTTTYSYVWNGTLNTGGMQAFGGWQITTTHANTETTLEYKDQFDRTTYTRNMADVGKNFTYDKGGRLTSEGAGSTLKSYIWYNSGKLKQQNVTAGSKVGTFQYDKVGNLTKETLTLSGVTYRNATATYDALGRLLTWSDTGTSSSTTVPDANITYRYDANGNIRNTVKTFKTINYAGTQTAKTEDFWFAFDEMNRLILDRGILENGAIVLNDSASYSSNAVSTLIGYNAAGDRKFAVQAFTDAVAVDTGEEEWIEDEDGYGGYWVPIFENVYFTNQHRENYTYDTAGRLKQVHVGKGSATADPNTMTITSITLPTQSSGRILSEYAYDKMGRQTSLKNFNSSGTTILNKATKYNAKSQVINDNQSQISGNKTTIANTFFFYRGEDISWNGATPYINTNTGSDAKYALGQTTRSWTYNHEIVGGTQTNFNPSETYYKYDFANGVELDETWYYKDVHNRDANDHEEVNKTFTTRDVHGTHTQAWIRDGLTRNVYYKTDLNGSVVTRDETVTTAGKYDPKEVRYRFGGKEMGFTGNNGDLNTQKYEASVLDHNTTPSSGTYQGAFRHRRNYGAETADFDNSYDRFNSYDQGSRAGTYTVQGGESLAAIASSIYGDAGLWYKIAQVNGISDANVSLVKGQSLILPAGISRSSYNATSFKPYDPGQALGDTSPTAPEPPKENNQKCGVFGQILLVVIAVAVTVVTAGATASLGPILSGAIAGAAGSVASQAVGVATGIQDKFSFKSVALAAIGGGVGGGLGLAAKTGGAVGKALSNSFIRGAVGSALTQGIGVATGLQDKFSWTGVAAAGVGGFVSHHVGDAFGVNPLYGAGADRSIGNVVANAATGAASSIAMAATRSAIDGSNFGQNVVASIPDVIGQTIGNAIGGALTSVQPYVPGPNFNPSIATADTSVANQGRVGKWAYTDRVESYADEIIVYGQQTSNYDDYVAGANLYKAFQADQRESGKTRVRMSDNYDQGVRRHNAQVDLNNAARDRINSMRGTLQSGLEISKYPDLLSHNWFGDYGTGGSSGINPNAFNGSDFGMLIVNALTKGPSIVSSGINGFLKADKHLGNPRIYARTIRRNADNLIHNAFETPRALMALQNGEVYSANFKGGVFPEDVKGNFNKVARIAKGAGIVLDVGDGAFDTYNRINNGEHAGFVVGDEGFELVGKVGGGWAGAAAGGTAGLVCGPGAIVCSPVLAIAGAIGGSYIGGEVGGDILRHEGEVPIWKKAPNLAAEGFFDLLGVPYSVPTGRGY